MGVDVTAYYKALGIAMRNALYRKGIAQKEIEVLYNDYFEDRLIASSVSLAMSGRRHLQVHQAYGLLRCLDADIGEVCGDAYAVATGGSVPDRGEEGPRPVATDLIARKIDGLSRDEGAEGILYLLAIVERIGIDRAIGMLTGAD